eukprot:TRINITY_DN13161_c0_g2_i1.p1 TRINITY_DN13161_c0_g2~~TRINITY_DN13161_c0_g2_i1.p1  ORF type:complete len:352 (+),score=48.99 TRINITY_DN13161_c0_g2_i1:41-1057(+)
MGCCLGGGEKEQRDLEQLLVERRLKQGTNQEPNIKFAASPAIKPTSEDGERGEKTLKWEDQPATAGLANADGDYMGRLIADGDISEIGVSTRKVSFARSPKEGNPIPPIDSTAVDTPSEMETPNGKHLPAPVLYNDPILSAALEHGSPTSPTGSPADRRCQNCWTEYPAKDMKFCGACGSTRGSPGGILPRPYEPPSLMGSPVRTLTSAQPSPRRVVRSVGFIEPEINYDPELPASYDRTSRLLQEAAETAALLQQEILLQEFSQQYEPVEYYSNNEPMGIAPLRSVLEQLIRERDVLRANLSATPEHAEVEKKKLRALIEERDQSISSLSLKIASGI